MDKKYFIKTIKYGLLGGLAGTIMMDIVMFVESWLMNQPITMNYAVIGAAVGKGILHGLIIHFLIGPFLGLLFSATISLFDFIRIKSIKRTILLGFWAGIITIPLGCVPAALLAGVPVLDLVGFSLLPHIVWGLTLGIVIGYGLKSTQTK